MNLKIPIETSARHVHMSQRDFELLFGVGATLTFEKELSQPGQYLAKERIMIVGPKGRFESMAILGPFRDDTQIEISVTDARKLGIPCMIRQSGDIEGTPGCTLVGPISSFDISKGVIVAKRHIHMTPREAIKMHVKDNDTVFVITKSYERSLIYGDVVVRVSKNFRLAMHVDTDESNAFANQMEPYGIIIKLHEDASYDVNTWMSELLEGIER